MRTYEATVRDYSRWLRGHAEFRARNGLLDAEEIMQETWLTVWRTWDSMKDAPVIGGILKRVLHQTATAMWKSALRLKRVGVIMDLDECIGLGAIGNQEASVELQHVSARVNSLRPVERDALTMRAFGDQYVEIGDHFGVTRQRAQQIVAKARQNVMKDL